MYVMAEIYNQKETKEKKKKEKKAQTCHPKSFFSNLMKNFSD